MLLIVENLVPEGEMFLRHDAQVLASIDVQVEFVALRRATLVPGAAFPWRVSCPVALSFARKAGIAIAMLWLAPTRVFRALLRSLANEGLSFLGVVRGVRHFTESLFVAHRAIAGAASIHACFASLPASVGLLASIIADVPFSFSAHARDLIGRQRTLDSCLTRARFAVACSRWAYLRLRDMSPAFCVEKICLIHHPIAAELVGYQARMVARTNGRVRLLAAGRFVAKKGFPLLLRAMARLNAEGVRVRLLLCGDGPERPVLERELRKLKLRRVVRLMPFQKQHDWFRLLRRVDVLVVPSVARPDGDEDGIPNVIIEALAAGCAVVASSAGGIREVIEPRRTGFLFRQGRTDKLVAALREALASPELRARTAWRGRATVIDGFHAQSLAPEWARLLRGEVTTARRIHVAQITEAFTGGVRTYLGGLASEIHDVRLSQSFVLSFGREPHRGRVDRRHLSELGHRVIPIPAGRELRPLVDLRTFFALVRILRWHRFDVIHLHSSKMGFLGRLAALLAGVPRVYYSPHGYAFETAGDPLRAWLYFWLERVATCFGGSVVALSQYEGAQARKVSLRRNMAVHIVKNGVVADVDEAPPGRCESRSMFRIPTRGLVVGMCARLVPQKGCELFLRAAHLVRHERPDVSFLMTGEGPLRARLLQLAAELELGPAFHLRRAVRDYRAFFAMIDVFVLPSLWEGVPFTLLEAMATGVPVVASSLPGVAEVVEADQEAVLVPPGNATLLARGILALVRDEHKRASMASAARNRVVRDCSLRRATDQLRGIYLDVATGAHQRQPTCGDGR